MKVFIAADLRQPEVVGKIRARLEGIGLVVTNTRNRNSFESLRSAFEEEVVEHKRQRAEALLAVTGVRDGESTETPTDGGELSLELRKLYDTLKNEISDADFVVALSDAADAAWQALVAESAAVPVVVVGSRNCPVYFGENVQRQFDTLDGIEAAVMVSKAAARGTPLQQPSRARKLRAFLSE